MFANLNSELVLVLKQDELELLHHGQISIYFLSAGFKNNNNKDCMFMLNETYEICNPLITDYWLFSHVESSVKPLV